MLGVLKVATATQFMRLVRPRLSDNKGVRNGLLVLQAGELVLAGGSPAGPAGRFGAPDRQGGAVAEAVGAWRRPAWSRPPGNWGVALR